MYNNFNKADMRMKISFLKYEKKNFDQPPTFDLIVQDKMA